MTTQTNRIAIALCESAGVKPYYPGKVNRWQWQDYLPEARRLVEVFKPDPDIERYRRVMNACKVGFVPGLSWSGGLQGIHLAQAQMQGFRPRQQVMPTLPINGLGSYVTPTEPSQS